MDKIIYIRDAEGMTAVYSHTEVMTDEGKDEHEPRHLSDPSICPHCGKHLSDFGEKAVFDYDRCAVKLSGWCLDCGILSESYFYPQFPKGAIGVEAQDKFIRKYVVANNFAASGLKAVNLP